MRFLEMVCKYQKAYEFLRLRLYYIRAVHLAAHLSSECLNLNRKEVKQGMMSVLLTGKVRLV